MSCPASAWTNHELPRERLDQLRLATRAQEEALEVLERAAELEPNDTVIQYELALQLLEVTHNVPKCAKYASCAQCILLTRRLIKRRCAQMCQIRLMCPMHTPHPQAHKEEA
eukprot:2473995-Pyramimonas_sp.AAC.1